MSRPGVPSRRLTPKRLALAAVGVAVIAGVFTLLRPDAIEVEVDAVRRTPLQVSVDAEGRTRVRDRFVITAPVSGRLQRMALEEGDEVRAGDVVARLSPAPVDESSARQARAGVAAARATVGEARTRARLAEAALVQAERNTERMRRLFEAGALSASAREDAELSLQSRRSDVDAGMAHVAAAEAESRRAAAAMLHAGGTEGVVLVRAPAAGRVLRLAGRSERVLAPGTAIAELGDTRAIEAVVDVLSSDAARVCEGMRVQLDGWGESGSMNGSVRRVEPAAETRVSALGVEEQRVKVIVDVADPPPSLGDGYRVDARIVVWESRDTLTVPVSALVRLGSGWGAYVVAGGRARLRAAEVGRMGGARALVLSGLVAGDRVLVFPSDKVRDGARITVR